MKTRVVVGGVLLSVGILSVGVQSTLAQERALVASGADGTTDSTDSGASGASGGSGTSSALDGDTGSGTSTGSGSTSTSLRDGSYTGTAVTTRYGNVQVQVTVSGGKITAVTALQLTDDDGRSVQISAQAAPVLQQEALSAQSADIDTVSGATYTSDGYIQSLQSALDQAG